MSHADYMARVHDFQRLHNPGKPGYFTEREWEFENKGTDLTRTSKEIAYRKARGQMRKRVCPNEKGYVWRLGYNCCTGQYDQRDDIPPLTGSSLLRKKKPAKKKPAPADRPPAVHVFSKRSRAKARDKACAFFRAIKKDRIFLTLTFIKHVTDQEGQRILNKFLTVIRKEIKGFEYIKFSEHQPDRKEKTIHFHILCNKRIPIRRYNALWVMQQYNAGLTGYTRTGRMIPKDEIEARYEDGTIHKVFNPVDVVPAYGISGLSAYLTKYVTKQDKDEEFGCLTWHCSRRVSRLFTSQVVGPSAFAFLHSFSNWQLDRSTGELTKPRAIKGAFYMVVFVNNRPAVLNRLGLLERCNEWLIEPFEPDVGGKIVVDEFRRLVISQDLLEGKKVLPRDKKPGIFDYPTEAQRAMLGSNPRGISQV